MTSKTMREKLAQELRLAAEFAFEHDPAKTKTGVVLDEMTSGICRLMLLWPHRYPLSSDVFSVVLEIYPEVTLNDTEWGLIAPAGEQWDMRVWFMLFMAEWLETYPNGRVK